MNGGGTFATTFLASVVEAIEMVAIVIGVGTIRGWRSTLIGVAVALGAAFHRSRTRIPRRVLILVVGLLLTAFGTFWGAEGLHVRWPGGDAALPALLGFYAFSAVALIGCQRRAWLGGRRPKVA